MYKKQKVGHKLFLFFLQVLLIIGCSGCGNKKENTENVGQDLQTFQEYDLTTEKWIEYKDVEEKYSWTVLESIEDVVQTVDSDLVKGDSCCVVWEGIYYSINHFYSIEEGVVDYDFYLHTVDLNTFGGKSIQLEFRESDIDGSDKKEVCEKLAECVQKGYARIAALDMNQAKLYAFFTIWDEEQYLQEYYVCIMDTDGKVVDIIDLQLATWGEQLQQIKHVVPPIAVCDETGLYYVVDNVNKKISVLDIEGSIKNEFVIRDCADEKISVCGKGMGCVPIFEYINTQGQTMIISIKDGEKNDLYLGTAISAKVRELDENGSVLFVGNEKLLCWDAAKGQCYALYDLEGLKNYECVEIARVSAEEVIIVLRNKTKYYFYRLAENAGAEQVEIELLQLYNDEYTKICAAEYSRQHPGILVTVSEAGNDKEVFMNQIVEQMKKGEGPDMLLLDKRQLVTLQDAECLATLEDYLGKELKENIFAGALEFGKIEDSLYAVPYEASMGTLLVSEDTWNKDSWCIQDIISLVDEMERNGNIPKRIYSIYYAATAEQLLYDLCLRNIENTEFLNIKEHTCYFETEEFYELLNFCKKLGEEAGSREYMTEAEMVEEVKSGEALAYAVGGGLIDYSHARAEFGDDYYPVGYPTNIGSGNQVHSYRGVAVNRWSENEEIIKDFIQFMLSKENQLKYTTYWVRKDVILESLYEKTELSENPVILMDDYSYIELQGREDGTSYADEYIELMEGGSPLSAQHIIQDIVLEEAGAYFAGDKTAQEVAGIIQSRVHLYLDER